MELDNTIVLRPRFQLEIEAPNDTLLNAFELEKTKATEFIVSRIDDHVFIKLPKHKQQFWSPQLHLEINAIDDNSSKLYGLFGPNSTVWTLFMFLHFVVAGLFIASAVWAYTNWSLKASFSLQLALLFLTVIIWVALYFVGRLGRASSKTEMHALHNFMNSVLNNYL